MPTVSRFYGIDIRLNYADHAPPHFHAFYGRHAAKIDIERISLIDGDLPPRALRLVLEWARLRQAELRAAWDSATRQERPLRIAPLP